MSQAERPISADELLHLYRQLLLIRLAEERLSALFADGAVPGFIHLSIGQEAVPVGVISNLGPADTVASTHRGHGHALAKGLSLDGFFAELLGMDAGLCRGRGGSMHVADFSLGMLGANGIVAAGMSIALGSALAHKVLGRDAVAVVFFGDGALAEGLLHECLNMAKLMGLPMLFVCENNGWSEFSPTDSQIAFSLESLAAGHGVRYQHVDGNNVVAVAESARLAVDDVRRGRGPIVLECKTIRVRGHFEGDPQKYRTTSDSELEAHDPLRIAAEQLRALGIEDEQLSVSRAEIQTRIDAAVRKAREGEPADFATALNDVYAA
ncbi:MAG: thiamine pyrophosphate-dependent dehydrogenase E1 component subunit alpha [Gammaproteobacteria bacterium]|nr:thiamine pyrophosphate-dependent dehydrogenase E1 component subunit alpha [Gammaproteobacteria bacterium]